MAGFLCIPGFGVMSRSPWGGAKSASPQGERWQVMDKLTDLFIFVNY